MNNIAIWINDISIFGGLERVTWTLYEKLKESSCNIKLISTTNANNHFLDNDCIILFPSKKYKNAALRSKIEATIIENNISTMIIEVSSLKTAQTVTKVAKKICKKVICVLHNSPYMYLKDFASLQYCIYHPSYVLKKIYKSLIKCPVNYLRLLSICTAGVVVTVGDFCRKELINCYSHFHINVQTIYNLVSITPNNIRKTQRTKRILFLGRFSMQKNLLLLLQVWKRINDILPEYHLLIVGEGKDKTLLEFLIKQRGIKNIQLLPKSNNVCKLYHDSDVCLLTSYFEGLPTVFIEAIGQNCPIFASKGKGGIGELTALTGNGLYVNSSNPKIIADALKEFIVHLQLPYKSLPLPIEFEEEYILKQWKELIISL